MRRGLVLKKETLTELTASELSVVAGAGNGGGPDPTPPQPVFQVPTVDVCPLTGPYPTLPIRDCIREG